MKTSKPTLGGRRPVQHSLFAILFLIGLTFILAECTRPEKKTGIPAGFVLGNEDLKIEFEFFEGKPWEVPLDAPDTTQVTLSQFAWQEFIALNWPSNYNDSTYTRGKPDTNKGVKAFLNPSGPLVWQTYKHRVEMYPKDFSNYNKSFDTPPQYLYDIDGQPSIKNLHDPNAPALRDIQVFNNLDETSEINLCTLFVPGDPDAPNADKYPNASTASGLPGAPRRMFYEAKGNRQMFDYVVKRGLYNDSIRNERIKYTDYAIKFNEAGAVYPCPDTTQICFPFGGDDGQEGSIEIKATWRTLTMTEYKSGRYLIAPAITYRRGTLENPKDTNFYYQVTQPVPTENSLPIGLVGLHIIHKTKNFPSYVFATFEQVDNLDTSQPHNTLFYYNRNSNPSVNPGKQYAYRYLPILQGTKMVNDTVHNQIRRIDPNSVWQYYKLIGVQGPPQNNANTTDYFLANIVTETNQALRDFSGTLDTARGTFNPTAINLYKGDQVFVQGGCKGCHGNAQKSDFSFITQQAPFDGTPDAVNQPLLKGNQTISPLYKSQ